MQDANEHAAPDLASLRDGFTAVVIGASGGIGSAIVGILENMPRCSRVIGLSRASAPPLDLADEASIEKAAAHVRETAGEADLIFDATGILDVDGKGPEKALRMIDPAAMARAFAINAIGPALLFKHFAPLLPRDRKGVFATLSARVGSIGDNRLGGWISYRASKAALNQIVRVSAIEVARRHPSAVCVALHPGTVNTRLSAPHAGSREIFSPHDCAAKLLSVVDGLDESASGGFYAHDGSAIEW